MTRYVRISEVGEITEVQVDTFEDIQEGVGGVFTLVPVQPGAILPRNCSVFANDNGYAEQLSLNPIAMAVTGYPQLVGPIMVAGDVDDEGNTLPIEQEQVDTIRRVARLMPNDRGGLLGH